MDPLDIHHVIRHPLSRIKTNNFQDKSGCSINGFRSFLFEEGMVRNLDDVESLISTSGLIQDYRGFPIKFIIEDFNNFPLSDEILRMKNVRFYFPNQSTNPLHKLVSPEPHFVEEERNLIEKHFKYLGSRYVTDDIEEWKCFDMNYEGHLVSVNSPFFHFSNESIEHLSNFPNLRTLEISITSNEEELTNFSILSNLRRLSIWYRQEFQNSELLKDLGLFSNLISLELYNDLPGFSSYQFL